MVGPLKKGLEKTSLLQKICTTWHCIRGMGFKVRCKYQTMVVAMNEQFKEGANVCVYFLHCYLCSNAQMLASYNCQDFPH